MWGWDIMMHLPILLRYTFNIIYNVLIKIMRNSLMMINTENKLLAWGICRLLRSDYQYGAWGGRQNSMSQKRKSLLPHQSGASQISWNIMYECYGPKKKAPKNVSYLPPLRHAASRSTNATPPSQTFHRLRATVFAQTLSKPKGRWEVTTFLSQKNSIIFSSILMYFIQIWTNFLEFLNQVVKHVIILLILLHNFRGIQYL